jgi:hypothetical protein
MSNIDREKTKKRDRQTMPVTQLARQAEQRYAPEVDALLREQCRDPRRIEQLLDGMLDFAFDEAMLRLYKTLCRYYYAIDPHATVSYVTAYREMWDEEVTVDNDSSQAPNNH